MTNELNIVCVCVYMNCIRCVANEWRKSSTSHGIPKVFGHGGIHGLNVNCHKKGALQLILFVYNCRLV